MTRTDLIEGLKALGFLEDSPNTWKASKSGYKFRIDLEPNNHFSLILRKVVPNTSPPLYTTTGRMCHRLSAIGPRTLSAIKGLLNPNSNRNKPRP